MISVETAPHYKWGGVCDGWRLLDQDAVSVIEESMPPGAAEVQHSHSKATQLFYVLSGALTLEVSGNDHNVTTGQACVVDPGELHVARNVSQGDVRFLVISSPSTREDRQTT